MNLVFKNQHQQLEGALSKVLGINASVKAVRHLSGGCINNAVLVTTDQGPFFVKWNHKEKYDMFLAESKGLVLLKDYSRFTIPEVLGCEIVQEESYLVLEFIENGSANQRYWEAMGVNLAALHGHHHDLFGLTHHNYIGSLHQDNTRKDQWIDFFIENRLEVPLRLALQRGVISREYADGFRSMYSRFKDLFPREKPSLLHGDLWSGNVMTASNGDPCLIDPATYYGHREMEIAFTRLFGGFDQVFYDSYQEAYPMENGFDHRQDVYNLYPLLVHLNLFGSSYLNSIDRIVRRFTD